MTFAPSRAVSGGSRHVFSVDVEEYFQVVAFQKSVAVGDWERYPSRVEYGTDRLLEALAESGNEATFFTLGWVARRHGRLLRRIVEAGHEVASHGQMHQQVHVLGRERFAADLREAKSALEDACGAEVIGFRAPSFSISPGMEWAFDDLIASGHQYDSSLFPIRRPDYGYPNAPAYPHLIERDAGTLVELPLTTLRMGGVRLPAAGGAYLRILPLALVQAALRQHERAGIPAMLYIHPWEVDEAQPRISAGWLSRVRHYTGLARTMPRLATLLRQHEFQSARALLAARPAASLPVVRVA